MEPELLVADEPIASLDVSIQAQIVNLLRHCNREHGCSMLFIAHDLSMVEYLCDRVGVMYHGKLVELAPTAELYANPQHPYTKALLSAVLDIDVDNPRERIILQGDIPSPISPPAGCRFCQRCPNATEICYKVAPKLVEIEPDHMIACHLYPECKPE
jgi:oligopeptide/dipeptide ABC transporter ATP-binding protein